MIQLLQMDWLLLIHQIPPKPAYLRVKIWRRLQRIGALPVKSSVYVLPAGDARAEDFQWTAREIVSLGGEASVCRAQFVEGLSDTEVTAMFHRARGGEYTEVADTANQLCRKLARASRARRAESVGAAARLRRRFEEIAEIDFLSAPGREAADAALRALERALLPEPEPPEQPAIVRLRREDHQRRTWVTRRGVHVDRMASAWLIRRFIDAKPRFKLVAPEGYRPAAGEIRFDMFEAELTHVGSDCTFEVILARFDLAGDPGLAAIARIVHELDVRDGRYDLPEIAGIGAVVNAIAAANRSDEDRLTRSAAVFDDLYELLRRRKVSR